MQNQPLPCPNRADTSPSDTPDNLYADRDSNVPAEFGQNPVFEFRLGHIKIVADISSKKITEESVRRRVLEYADVLCSLLNSLCISCLAGSLFENSKDLVFAQLMSGGVFNGDLSGNDQNR